MFGSYARDEINEFSDIDIVVELSVPDIFTLVHIKSDLEGMFHKPVDIIRKRNKMNPYLKKRIDRDAIYVR